MKNINRFGIACCCLWLATSCQQSQVSIAQEEETLRFIQNGNLVWQFNHNPSEGKPYFHPLATTKGKLLTGLRPEDHPWHRALWFSWKYINGVNYWEESRETGKSEGLTKLNQVERSIDSDNTVTIKMNLAYAPAADEKNEVMTEKRTIVIDPPDSTGTYRLDWSSDYTALNKDVVLDRTPIPGEEGGKSWGGYAGYSVRLSKSALGGTFLNSEGQTGEEANRKPARWMAYNAPGGGGLLILDHPSNMRYPNQWYLNEDMPYFSPAVIHDGPQVIPAGETLSLRYRLVVHPGLLKPYIAEQEWKNWAK